MALELSQHLKARIQELTARYPRRQAALLPVLHEVQHELGYLSIEAQAAVARELDVPPTTVHEVTTFYEMYHQHPEGQYHLEICTNISCHLAGADALVAHVKRSLGVEVGHLTPDGLFSLMEAECLASCGSGPMMKCGRDYYEYLTGSAVDALIARFRAEAPALEGKHYEHGKNGPHVGPVPGFEPPKPESALPVPSAAPAAGAPASTPPAPAPEAVAAAAAETGNVQMAKEIAGAAEKSKAIETTVGTQAPTAAGVKGPLPSSMPGVDDQPALKVDTVSTGQTGLASAEPSGAKPLPSFEPPPLKRKTSGPNTPAEKTDEKAEGTPGSNDPSGRKET